MTTLKGNEYVNQLDMNTQETIKAILVSKYNEMGMTQEETQEGIEMAMDSKVSDLNEFIVIEDGQLKECE